MPAMGICEWIAAGRAIAEGQLTRYAEKAHFTDEFEQSLREMTGAKHALAVTSGTGALIAALAAAGIGPGDEVLVPAYTWMATATAPVMVGAVPILVDINETLTIDPEDIERKITPYTRAIIPVHMGNAPCDMDAIMAIAKKHGLIVIEDACQSVGVTYKGRALGSIGHLGALSFNKMKNLNIGEGGAVLTSDDQYFARARSYHDLGAMIRGHEDRYNEPAFIGVNMKVNEIQSAMAQVQLRKVLPMLERQRRRRASLAPILARSSQFQVTPHNDAESAISLTVLAPTREAAIALEDRKGIWNRLRDNSKHIYTNWEPIFAKRTFHPKMNPWAWAKREITYTPDMCARTLDILERTCVVNLGLKYPTCVMRRVAKGLAV
ncbi:aminotransferase, DegT/DnrJ/EryC1/StrS family [Hyphomonas neptunium ATCC 15444]|uniref:Aminotransferase, DegT/DnrJ/EryC1/StrS family n=2 Tax=Hyphomonas TaxID=85 RepID=Q0C005_HYPNA|nr:MULTISPECIES: aminotransferase class I/II-fold pyridoxal phosphate-dependent enzyme [Hyphomonas]ABI76096.1 aminotransferase, DegT/DnrJ/EryC1/StrS family [Hyphomonas neptunium ATCC 15444]KCZ86627.1 aminotransferase [Hyphomonas hirschiana VP5]